MCCLTLKLSNDCQHLTVHASSILLLFFNNNPFFVLFCWCPKTNRAARGVFQRLSSTPPLMKLNTGKRLRIFVPPGHSRKRSLNPPPQTKSIANFFQRLTKYGGNRLSGPVLWSAFTPGLARSTLPPGAAGCTGVPSSVMQVWAGPPPPIPSLSSSGSSKARRQ